MQLDLEIPPDFILLSHTLPRVFTYHHTQVTSCIVIVILHASRNVRLEGLTMAVACPEQEALHSSLFFHRLLNTSDAADDPACVVHCGRLLIHKTNNIIQTTQTNAQ